VNGEKGTGNILEIALTNLDRFKLRFNIQYRLYRNPLLEPGLKLDYYQDMVIPINPN